ncbi:hypothetical protein FHS49_001657 [Sphingobium boeckii]|uniref:Uncharacterized protein n=2 Tax=Sphingobium boeckii TaxID=1082345 RepID=A0A7W9AHC1_9SPHN|nr:hypothetical protein [Sphingobium boeckii]MBB5685649.1 hypothetical protein [Sphingobium boeckii]
MASAQAKGQAAQAAVNRDEANRSAMDAMERGNIEQQQHYRKVSATMGSQRAAMAANGLDISFGSAADLVGDTAMYGQEDAATIAQNTVREARGFEIEAANYSAQGKSAKLAAKGAIVKGVFDMGSSILGGATQYGKLKGSVGGSAQNFGDAYGAIGSRGPA